MTKRAFLFIIFLLSFAGGSAFAGSLRDGDIIFQTSRSAQSLAIQRATHSKYSHVGIIFVRGGKPYVYEAIKTVRYTPLEAWIVRGAGHHYVIKRLRDAERVRTPEALSKLRHVARAFQGKPYDLTFEWSDDRIYCSELVWKMYDRALGLRLGRLQRLREFDLTDVAVRAKLKERYGNRVPLDETVISPDAIFEDEGLVAVEAK
jgi:hypothetical protein